MAGNDNLDHKDRCAPRRPHCRWRPPSPLEKIQPDGWLAEYTSDLINLLNVLGRVIALEPVQASMLDAICVGPLMTRTALAAAGLLETATVADEPVA